MGYVSVAFHEALSALGPSFRTVELRTAAYRGLIGRPPTGDWRPLRSLIRISFRDAASVRESYAALQERLKCRRTESFAIFQEVLPYSDLLKVPPEHGLCVEIEADRPRVVAVHLPPPTQLTSTVSRFRQRGQPSRGEEWPAIDYFFVPPTAPSAGAIDLAKLHAEVRRELGVATPEALLHPYLERSDLSNQPGSVFIQIEMPAMITSLKAHGERIDVEVSAHRNLGDVRLFMSKRTPDGTGIEMHTSINLTELSVSSSGASDLRIFGGTATVHNLAVDDSLEFVLTHAEIPELDNVIHRVRDLLPITEINPLLACLRRFWHVDDLLRSLEQPYVIKGARVDATPQTAFQARSATLLTLAGFQAIDLGNKDLIRDPNTRVEIATADILAYHAQAKLLLICACTINVPKAEDYERLLHVTSILQQEVGEERPFAVVPVLFTGQEPTSVLSDQAASRGLRLITRQEFAQMRALLNSGREDRVLSFLTFSIGGL